MCRGTARQDGWGSETLTIAAALSSDLSLKHVKLYCKAGLMSKDDFHIRLPPKMQQRVRRGMKPKEGYDRDGLEEGAIKEYGNWTIAAAKGQMNRSK